MCVCVCVCVCMHACTGGQVTTGCAVSVMAYAHYAGRKLSVPVDLVVMMMQEAYPEFTHFPPRQTARVGFKLEADILKSVANVLLMCC